MTTTIQNLAHLLHTELTTLEDVEALPVGAGVVDDFGVLYQREYDRLWYPALKSALGMESAALLTDSASLLLAWLPPEARS